MRVVPLDPSLGGARTGAKMGFDCTIPFGKANTLEFSVPTPPVAKPGAQHKSAADALAAGPASFLELMAARGSKDGREIVRELDALYAAQRLGRNEDGRYVARKRREMTANGIGKPVRRKEDLRLITGRGEFSDDLNAPNQVHAIVLRSPHAHAHIRAIDASAALAMPGVLAVLTGRDYVADGHQSIPNQSNPRDVPVIEFRRPAGRRSRRIFRSPSTRCAMPAKASR